MMQSEWFRVATAAAAAFQTVAISAPTVRLSEIFPWVGGNAKYRSNLCAQESYVYVYVRTYTQRNPRFDEEQTWQPYLTALIPDI